ncbi:MAG: CPBP family glutamic-type intramembrane protease [Candidatus Hydrogenedentota bacterium]
MPHHLDINMKGLAMAQRFFSRTGFCLWIGATIGVICVLPFVNALFPEALQEAAKQNGLPAFALIAMSIGQSALLLGLMTFSGLWAARKLGLGAPVLDAWLGGDPLSYDVRRSALIAFTLGLASGFLLIALDFLVFLPLDPNGLGQIVQTKQPSAWVGFLASFSGGISEEVQLRLFFMSFLALGIRYVRDFLFPTRSSPLTPAVFWSANIIAAVLFGLRHLPVTAELVGLTPLLIVRAIVLNGILGVLAGFLFWRRGIEMAMVCHFAADLVLHVLPPLVGY